MSKSGAGHRPGRGETHSHVDDFIETFAWNQVTVSALVDLFGFDGLQADDGNLSVHSLHKHGHCDTVKILGMTHKYL